MAEHYDPLKAVVRRELLPDPLYVVETTTKGMKVTVCVKEQRGRFEITREIFWTDKSVHNWIALVSKFKELAIVKYSRPTVSQANLYKSGS
jgi:hypothetical protein